MKIFRARSFTADRAWAAVDIANMDGITTRLHGTDRPYRGTSTTARRCLPCSMAAWR